MNVPLNNCIFCGGTDDLNTELGVTIDDGVKVTVLICDTHAEVATVKTAREAYHVRRKQIDDFMVQATVLGLTISQPGQSGLAIATLPGPKTAVDSPGQPAVPGTHTAGPQTTGARAPNGQVIVPVLDDDMVDAEVVDRAGRRGMISVGARLSGLAEVGAHRSHATDDLRQQLPEQALRGKVKLEQVEDRAGRPITIPGKRVDGTGVTHIKVVETGGDAALQKRFKRMADLSRIDQQPDFRNDYDIKPCPICHGNMVVQHQGKEITCPKCKGNGVF